MQESWITSFSGHFQALWQGTRDLTVRKLSGVRSRRRRSGPAGRKIEFLESRTLLAALVSLNSSSSSFAENSGTAVVTATLTEPQTQDVFVTLDLGGTAGNNVGYRATTNAAPITVDGKFGDWRNNPNVSFRTDAFNDTHDTDTSGAGNTPTYVNHPDADLVEFAVTHDDNNVYFYFRSTGIIGRTQVASPGKTAGRYYAIVTMDVDNNDVTGYQLHEGGYYPTTNGYDMNAEIEYFGGQFNTGHYLNHGATDPASLIEAFEEQSQGGYNPALASQDIQGPFAPGFVDILPGTYDYYTQWVYKNNDPARGGNDSITFVKDKGPIVQGIIQQAVSADGHEMEMIVPYKGFLKDAAGNPIVDIGKVLDLSFSLEASSELAPGGEWASDTADPINGYLLKATAEMPVNVIRIPAGQTSASLTLTGLSDAKFNPSRTAHVEINSVVGATEDGTQAVTLNIQNDDPPSISTTPTPLDYAADSPAVAVDAGLSSVDPVDSLYSGATVSITGGFVSGQDTLFFTNQSGISGSYDSATGVLTLTGSATVASYLNALRSVSFQNSSNETTTVVKTITFQVSGDGLSGSAAREVRVNPSNKAPQITLFDTPVAYTVTSPAVVLDTNVVISDSDSLNFDGGSLTVEIVNNVDFNDLLEIRSQGNLQVSGSDILFGGTLIGSFSGGSNSLALVILLNSNATVAITQELLRNITFRNGISTPSFSPRTVQVTLTDGDGGTSLPSSKTVNLFISSKPPVIGLFDTTISYTEGNPAVLLDTNVTVTDVDSPNFDTGRLTIGLSTNAQKTDRLEIRHQGTGAGQIGVSGANVSFGGNVIGTQTGGSGATPLVVALNGNATPAAVQALLRNITFRNISNSPTNLIRKVRVTLTDGDGGTSLDPAKLIRVIDRNSVPVIGAFDTTVSYTENATPVVIDGNATVSDVDSPTFDTGRLTVQLTSNAQNTDRLEVRNQGTGAEQIRVEGTRIFYGEIEIGTTSGGSGASALVVSLNGNATVSAVQALLRNITYRSLSDNPSKPDRTVRVLVSDGDGGTSVQQTKLIQVIARNDAPMIGGLGVSTTYRANTVATLLASSATVTDPDSSNLDTGKLTVRISGNAQNTDQLEIRNQGTGVRQIGVSGANVTYEGLVIGSFTGGMGATPLVVTFNANATPLIVQTLIRNLTFKNTSAIPSTRPRTISMSLTDGDGGTSLTASKQVSIIL